MKKLRIHFLDTDETVTLDETSDIFAWGNHEDAVLSTKIILTFDETLPGILRKQPLMFYIYEDTAILKLYRSAYIDNMEWLDQ